MQFIKQGPDVPERLLLAHEEGRVVFFCGAGISYPAGLPGFNGLVDKICQGIGHTPNDVEKTAIKQERFDTAIGLFESTLMGGRTSVRRAIVEALKPDYSKADATKTHESLLVLGRTRDRRLRIITTNFDRIFEDVINRDELSASRFQAPYLPIPKARWDGLVYLHGLINSQPTDSELDRLVVSSGDFGLAYLTERWASRFVSELFRNFTVCFVGYSINDPVLRYMTDALAADRILGESPPEMFCFAEFKSGSENAASREWSAKGVTPLLYNSDAGHDLLHETIKSWADTYRDGVNGKGQIVATCAPFRPMASTSNDDFVGRMLWAIADMGGLPARIFSEINPCPDIAWLEVLSEEKFRHGDLIRFGVHPGANDVNKDMTFSILRRPPQCSRAQLMSLTYFSDTTSSLDPVLFHLAKWLLRHLNEPALIHWIAKRGGRIHAQFAFFVNDKLSYLHKLESEQDHQKIIDYLKQSPNGVPGPAMSTLWRLILSGRLKGPTDRLSVYNWKERVIRDGITASLKMELKEILSPRLEVRKPFDMKTVGPDEVSTQSLNQIVEAEVMLPTERGDTLLKWEEGAEKWNDGLASLLPTFTDLLVDALGLLREIGKDQSEIDFSHIYYKVIGKISRSSSMRGWVLLVELSRLAYDVALTENPNLAKTTASLWWSSTYIPMRRLALYAASKDLEFDIETAIHWLIADERKWLFNPYTLNESRPLLRQLAPRMNVAQNTRLQEAGILGPPKSIFWDSIDDPSFEVSRTRHIWELLTTLKEAGAQLIDSSAAVLAEIERQNPEWNAPDDDFQEDEEGWTGRDDGTKGPIPAPKNAREIKQWLQSNPSADRRFTGMAEDWPHWCRERFLPCALALISLARMGVWPKQRWSEALRSWSSDSHLLRAWLWAARPLSEAPDEVILATAWWTKEIAKKFEGDEGTFIVLIKRILSASSTAIEERDDILMEAINHTAGYAAEAVFDWWFRNQLQDNQGIEDRLKDLFEQMLAVDRPSMRASRVILGSHLLALFRVDPQWTQDRLIPLFSWNLHREEAPFLWAGFLWGPRLYRPLFEKLKPSFLECASNYVRLGDKGVQYAALLTYIGLDPSDVFTNDELMTAVHLLNQDGLNEVARTLARAIEGAEEQKDKYWLNRIKPFIQKYFPKERRFHNDEIAGSFATICSLSAHEFVDAFAQLRPWLMQIQWSDTIINNLDDDIPFQNTDEVLHFLSIIVGVDGYVGKELKIALDKLLSASAVVSTDPRYIALRARLRE